MECPQGALASGFLSESVTKMVSVMDDFSAAHGVSGDDLFVDELLDFSNDLSEEEGEEEEQKLQKLEEKQLESRGKACPVPMEKLTAPEGGAASVNDDFGPLPETELNVPAEGLESLEWLSHFVEDSFPDYSLTGILLSTPAENRNKPDTKVKEQACFMAQFLTKARTKRARTGVRVWSVLSPPFTESSSSSSSSTTSFSFLSSNSWAVHGQTGEPVCEKPPLKKQKKKPSLPTVGGGVAAQPRRCSHCGVTKTPQWRAGPLGSKTLCNACGVRFKSGRLLPEYRPACSPTFSSDLHSNNHRKVLEMRQRKEPELETVAPPVQSF